jgi:hypothetical protein
MALQCRRLEGERHVTPDGTDAFAVFAAILSKMHKLSIFKFASFRGFQIRNGERDGYRFVYLPVIVVFSKKVASRYRKTPKEKS